MKRVGAVACLVVLGVFLGGLAWASPADDARKMVEEASAFLSASGKDKTIQELNNPNGKFVKGELYVFAYDTKATVIAHPVNPKLIGKNLMEVPDADGKLFRKEVVEVAQAKGTGWVDYKYKNPKSNKMENKTTFVKKNGDLILCCGAYK